MTSRASISTSVYGTAYLAKAWKERSSLAPYERRGFGQFFYLTICGYLECVIAKQIEKRIEFINLFIGQIPPPSTDYQVSGGTFQCSTAPLFESLSVITSSISNECKTAPLSKLMEIHGKVFPDKLSQIVGPDLSKTLDALAKLRNLFAHGRELFMEFPNFDLSNFGNENGTLNKNPLKNVAHVLFEAKILKKLEITGMDYNDFFETFYSDKALIYFYDSVKQIEEKLQSFHPFEPETVYPRSLKLPKIEI